MTTRWANTAAVIGCGGAGLLHAQSYLDAGVELLGVCDLDERRGEVAARRFGVRSFPSIPALLAERPGIVSVTTSEPHHVDPVVAVLAAGADVLCEKVMADSLAGARRILDAVAASPARMAVDYNYRFIPAMLALRDELASGTLGTLTAAAITTHPYCWHHTLDLVRFLFGPVASVRAAESSRERRERPRTSDELVYIPDPAASAVLTTASGTLVSLTSTYDSPLDEEMIAITVFGESGRVTIDRMRLDDVNGEVVRGRLAHADGLDRPFSLDDSFAASIAAVVAAEREGSAFPTTQQDGWEMVRLEAALRTSIDEGREVEL